MPGAHISKRNPTGYPDFTLPIGLLMQLIPVKLVPDWGAIEAEDLDVIGGTLAPTDTDVTLVSYTVPEGKTLLIYDWAIVVSAATTGVTGALYNATDMVTLGYGGGNSGFATPLSKPKRVKTGKTVQVVGMHNAGTDKWLFGHMGGVLI